MMRKPSHSFDQRERPHKRSGTLGARAGRILTAAFEEFAANGYAGARLDGVARRANVAKGTIYLYFPSKSQLFQAVIRSLIQPVPEDLDSRLASASAPTEQLLEEFISRQYSGLVGNRKARAMVRLLIAESGKFPQIAEMYKREVIAPGMNALRRLLERGIARGEFRDSKLLGFPQILVAPAVLAAVWILIFGPRVNLDLEGFRAAHVELVFAALHGGLRSVSVGERASESRGVGE